MKDKYINDMLAKQAYIKQNMSQKDPFDKGIMRAVKSAKKSLAMDEEQEDAALRNSILAFGEEMHKMPKTRGFMSNFAQVGRALNPAIKTHDAHEAQAKEENMKMLQYAQALRAAEEAKIDNLEYQAYLREHADKVLAEQKNYHQQSILAKFAKAAAKKNGMGQEGQFGPDFITIDSAPIRNSYAKEKKNYGAGLKHANDTIAAATALEGKYKNDKISPTGPFSMITAPAQKLTGILTSNNKLKEKSAEIENLNSELVELKAGLERALKGGVLGPKILEYFDREKVYPTIYDTTETRNKKLATIQKKLKEHYEASDLSLKHGVQIDPSNLDQFKNYINLETNNSPDENQEQEEWISIISPSGRKEEVYYEDVPKLLKLPGYKRADR
jgi:hypothetical protein